MGTPLKVSDGLFAVARQEANAADRSITAQVEHWAKIGRAVEAVLAHKELLRLKKVGEILEPVFSSAARRREVHELLTRIAMDVDREGVRSMIRKSRKPVYASDPSHPGMIVQVLASGRRRLGRLEGRRFVPVPAKAPR